MVERGTLQRLARGMEAMAIQALRKPCRIVWVEPGESAPAAVARFLEENPGIEDMYEFLLVSWLTAGDEAPPPPREPAGRLTVSYRRIAVTRRGRRTRSASRRGCCIRCAAGRARCCVSATDGAPNQAAAFLPLSSLPPLPLSH
jgi:hypothetical protein